jgi:hypothetical protein
MWWKQLLAKYAIIFVLGSFGSFILLVTLAKNINTPVFIPGDLIIKQTEFTVYLPFGTAIVLGVAACFAVELYYFFAKTRWHS